MPLALLFFIEYLRFNMESHISIIYPKKQKEKIKASLT